jgi:hypothetical protein
MPIDGERASNATILIWDSKTSISDRTWYMYGIKIPRYAS